MANNNQLTTAWLADLTNPHHDGTTQQIDDYAQAFETDSPKLKEKIAAVHRCRLKEDEVWLKSQRDPAVKDLEKADKRQDGYISAARHIIMGHAGLPDGEPTKEEAKECEQVFKDFQFRTNEAYGSESDKIVQMGQNLQAHRSFLEQIGAWTFYQKASAAAVEVRQLLGDRARTKAEFVKGEMKAARRATDVAIAEFYKVLMALHEVLPTEALTALVMQLKGIELYARQYYIAGPNSASSAGAGGTSSGESGNSGNGSGSGSDNGGGSGNGSGTGDDNGGGSGNGSGSGDDNGGGSGNGSGSGDDNGGGSGNGSGSGDDNGGGGNVLG